MHLVFIKKLAIGITNKVKLVKSPKIVIPANEART